MEILSKLYKKAAGIPLAITTLIGIVLCLTHDGSHYKSEWSTDDGYVLTIGLTIILSSIISIFSYTIFLNKWAVIKNNKIFSFLSWIFLPGTICLFVIYLELLNFTGLSNIDGHYTGDRRLDSYITSMSILHLTILSYTFIIFRKTKSNDFPNPTKQSHNDLLTY